MAAAAASSSHVRASHWLALACLALAVNTTVVPLAVSAAAAPSAVDLQHCPKSCGYVNISYPFGIGSGCFRPGFEVVCSRKTQQQPPKLFLANTTTQILNIYPGGYIEASIVFNIDTWINSTSYNLSWEVPGQSLMLWTYPTQVVIVGCGIEACVFDAMDGTGAMLGCCASMCGDVADMENGAEGRPCSGMGCCYIEITATALPVRAFRLAITQKEEVLLPAAAVAVSTVKAFLQSYVQTSDTYSFSMSDLISDKVNASTIGALSANLSPVITDQPNCQTAKMHERYACEDSKCQDTMYMYGYGSEEPNGGYWCVCPSLNNKGNLYLVGGCTQEYNPIREKLNCSRSCGNTSIPFPFGLEPGCSSNTKFLLNCTSNQSLIGQPPAQYQVEKISVNEGLFYVHKYSEFEDDEPLMTAIGISSVGVIEQFIPDLVGFDFFEQSGIWKWVISNTTCDTAKNLTTYACTSANSECFGVTHGHDYIGYRCTCSHGYEGNPYVTNGCYDTDECLVPYLCNGTCHNWEGGYNCTGCPHGTSFDPEEMQCISTKNHSLIFVVAIGLGTGFGVLALIICTTFLGQQWKRHNQLRVRRKYFLRNKGLLLEQLIISSEGSVTQTKQIFSLEELEIATNNFDSARIVSCGGHGTVYKGILSDQRVVAIKKPKIIKQSEIDQFINEVAILSQIIHRNVVKLFGCCLESEVPLLVYEFISNGTLHDLLHYWKTGLSRVPGTLPCAIYRGTRQS